MPLDMLTERELGMRSKVLLGVVGLALLWLALQTGLLEAVLALGLASPTVAGLLVLVLIAYWALDELEDDDDASDVIDKTTSRAESASKGLLDGTAALIMGVAGIGLTVGADLLDLLMTAPLAAANIGTIGAGLAGAMGLITSNLVLAIGVSLLVLGLIARRRGAAGA